jgi:hypothetical protein
LPAQYRYPQLGEQRHFRRIRVICRRFGDGRVALGLGGRDVLEHEFQPFELALDLPPQALRQFKTITSAQFLQASPPVAA